MSPPPRLGIAGALTRAFITSPLTPLFLLASLVFGLVALASLPREEEPQISVPMVDIHVRADGLRAEDAVKLITEPLETIVKGIDGVEHVYSQSQDDQVLVTARFVVGTSSDAAVLRVHDKVRANMDRIPVGVPEPLIVGRGIDDVAILALTLTPTPQAADRITANDLTRVARELRTEIAKIADVGLTYLVGESGEMIRVAPDPARLALYGVTLQQLAAKVAGANETFPAGRVRDDGEQIGLMAGETLRSPGEIGDLLLTTRDERPVYVRDVAEIDFATEAGDRLVSTVTLVDGAPVRVPAVTLAIAKRAGSNAVAVAEAILARVESLKGLLVPEDMTIEVTRDYGETANEKANELLYHLGLATLSIIALVGVAIGRREAVVVAVVIPVTILLTLFAAWLMGYTLNRVSLFALIFSIGILVDDAIVVIENIARHWAMGDDRDRRQAAIEAVAEVGNPTIVATLTVVAALLPMLFVSGMMGPYMSPIPANASAAMIFSFFVAVTVTPWLMLKVAGNARPAAHGDHAGGGALGRAYAAVARPVLRTKAASWTLLVVVGALTLGSLALFYTRHVTVKLLPFDNKSELSVVIDLPEGASVEATDAVAQTVRPGRAGPARGPLGSGPCRDGGAVQLQRPRAPFVSAGPARTGRRGDQSPPKGRARPRRATRSRSTSESASRRCRHRRARASRWSNRRRGRRCSRRCSRKSTDPTRRPAGRWPRKSRPPSARSPSSSTWTIPSARPRASSAPRSRPTTPSSSASKRATSSTRSPSSAAGARSDTPTAAAGGSRFRSGSNGPRARRPWTSGS